jgi:hypothetical protein
LDDLDSLLSSGNIPDLFESDELYNILMDIKTEAYVENAGEELEDLQKFFLQVVNHFLLL